MIKRDYIIKLIQQLMDSLFLLLNNKNIDDEGRKYQLEKFYIDYLGVNNIFFLNSPLEDLITYLKDKYAEDELLYRIEMLSEIMYYDAIFERDLEIKDLKLSKALTFLEYLDEYSNTYSLLRIGKIEELKKLLL